MFKWANKESLQIRTSKSKAKSLQTEKSYPSSPAHSNATLDSRILANNSNKKKILLKTNRKQRGVVCNLFESEGWDKSSKTDLIKLMENKKLNRMNDQNKNGGMQIENTLSPTCKKKLCFSPKRSQVANENIAKLYKQPSKPKKSTIKIIIPQNQLLSEFFHAYGEVRLKIWNAYSMAFILWQMGFIEDMVNDRQMIKKVWSELYSPDVLIIYTFIEKVMNNKVNVQEAAKILEVTNTEFANLWLHTSNISASLVSIMSQMRNNRSNRKRKMHEP